MSARVPAGPARAHFAKLRRQGVLAVAVSEATGIPEPLLNRIRHGENRTVTADQERAILSLTREIMRRRERGLVPVIGTRRRLQALQCIGWDRKSLSERLGFDTRSPLCSRRALTSREIHDAVVELYRRLCDVAGPSPLGGLQTLTRGYQPPLAWAGIDMDDPAARPRPPSDDNDAIHLVRTGAATVAEAAAQCGIDPESIVTTLRRAAKRAGPGTRDADLHRHVVAARKQAGEEAVAAAARERARRAS